MRTLIALALVAACSTPTAGAFQRSAQADVQHTQSQSQSLKKKVSISRKPDAYGWTRITVTNNNNCKVLVEVRATLSQFGQKDRLIFKDVTLRSSQTKTVWSWNDPRANYSHEKVLSVSRL